MTGICKLWKALAGFYPVSFTLNCFLIESHSCQGSTVGTAVPQRSQSCVPGNVTTTGSPVLEPAWALGKECPGVSVLEQGNRLCRQGLGTLADSPLSRSQLGTGSVMKSHIRGCVSNNIVKGNGCSHLFSSICIPEATPEVAPSLSSFVVPMEKICILRKLVKRLD